MDVGTAVLNLRSRDLEQAASRLLTWVTILAVAVVPLLMDLSNLDDTYYAVHIDQTLDDAMKKPLTSEQRKAVQKPAPATVNGNGIKLAPTVLNFKK